MLTFPKTSAHSSRILVSPISAYGRILTMGARFLLVQGREGP
ncbi:rCG45629 [Rattus norvegicus]|uniref:RCG45629 n=1 Tax=Rattus norvegicus TaxID=10116 RepID=A6JTZ5_RAT|nr:rCG45629 [Rattus norvegicus]